MKKVLFLTSNNLATNPRLYKELALGSQKFQCTLIYFDLANWSEPLDVNIRSSLNNVTFEVLPASRKFFLPWFISSVVEKLSRIIYPLFKGSLLINALAHSKRTFLMNRALKKHRGKHDLVVAHNLAALYAAFKFASENNIPFSFDIEDYHPGELSQAGSINEKYRRTYLMQKLLPLARYVSYASPLIGKEVLRIVPSMAQKTYFLLNNSFSNEEFICPLTKTGKKLNFVWFSQNITFNRGLELFLPVLNEFEEDIHVTLIGNLNSQFYNDFLKKYSNIVQYQRPLPQKLLHKQLAKYDIGLAVESIKMDFNRELCLTNKILAYTQAGLYVLATKTKGQTLFIEQNPWSGTLVGYNSNEVREVIKNLIKDKESIRECAQYRYVRSEELAWENEQVKIINIWKSLD